MHVVVAPDKFKGSATAHQVAQQLTVGLRATRPDIRVTTLPVADGGEGTLDAAASAGFTVHPAIVAGPVGEPVQAAWARRGDEAVVEMSLASGLAALPRDAAGHPVPAPLHATSRGAGELIAAALDAGCTRVVLGVGGSATTDGGAGMLQGLGVRLLDAQGADLPGGGAALARLAAVDVSGLHPGVRTAQVVLAADVDNPLTGRRGAAAVFGPQKGATAQDVTTLDAALVTYRDVLVECLGAAVAQAAIAPGAGAAGGAGFAALAVLGAQQRPGIDVVLELVDLAGTLRGADLVITGEGSLDEQSLGGKTPVGVLRVGRSQGVPVVAVCGRTTLDRDTLHRLGFHRVYALLDRAPDAPTAMRETARLLVDVARDIIADHDPSGCGPGASPLR